MPAPEAALAQYDEQARIAEAATRAALLLWGQVNPNDVSGSWQRDAIGDRLFVAVAQAQLLAASSADAYADLSLAQQGVDAPSDGALIPSSLSGIASDGRDLASLLLEPVILSAITRSVGATPLDAMRAGQASLVRIVDTQVADAGRAAQSVASTTRVEGYIRAVHPGACGRCVVLAGRWYRYNAGFDRHPLCHCYGIPASEDVAGDATTDPMAYFHSLTHDEQNKALTTAGAQAVRDGADISQVVNARRGALGLSVPGALTPADRAAIARGEKAKQPDRFRHLERVDVFGRSVAATTEGTTVRGLAGKRLLETTTATKRVNGRTVVKTPRLMPEAIYEISTDRADAVRLLRRFGYIR